MEPACKHLEDIALEVKEITTGKTILSLKAVCAIYQNMVNKVASATDESLDINLIKEKIRE